MESRIKCLFLTRSPRADREAAKGFGPCALLHCAGLLCVLFAMPGRADDAVQVIQPEVEPRIVTEDMIDTENFEIGGFVGMLSVEDFGVSPVYGIRLAYHATEDVFLELNYGYSDTEKSSFEELNSGGVELVADREYSYYSMSAGWAILPGESFVGGRFAFNSALYLIAGAGASDFAGDERFTINAGFGYRLLFTDLLALRLEVRDYLFDSDVVQRNGDEKITQNVEFSAGISMFF